MNIIGLFLLYPTMSVAEITKKCRKKSFTTRAMACLQNYDIIKREGGRKEGRWVVLTNRKEDSSYYNHGVTSVDNIHAQRSSWRKTV